MNEANLKKQLSSLVDDFGYHKVRKTLTPMKHPHSKSARSTAVVMKSATRTTKPKPDAIAVVVSLNLGDSQKRGFLVATGKRL